MKVLLDTNVLLDVLGERAPFYKDSAQVWTLVETGQITGYISALSFPNVFYLLRKLNGPKAARLTMAVMRDIFTPVPLDARLINEAIEADIKDLEDTIQFFSALRAGVTTLVTRNPKDFPAGDIAIQTPAEFLAMHFAA